MGLRQSDVGGGVVEQVEASGPAAAQQGGGHEKQEPAPEVTPPHRIRRCPFSTSFAILAFFGRNPCVCFQATRLFQLAAPH